LFSGFLVAVMLLLPVGGGAAAGDRDAAARAAKEPAVTAVEKGPTGGGRISPGEIPAWQARWELARTLTYLKRYEESLGEYRKLLQQKPDLSAARAEMANVLFWAGRPKEALAELERIPSGSLGDRDSVLMADLYAAEKRYEQARPLYAEYLNRHPDDQAVRLKLAQLLSWTKQYEASLTEYEKILKARPEDVQVRRKYAQVLLWASRYGEAAAELRKTLR
jgi:tetratricopeptide (TPR) repeat protein